MNDLVDERLFFTYSVLNTAATPLHNAQPWRLFMLVFWICTVPDTYQKQALRFEDQLVLLQQRGLEFDDLDRALSQIRAISYYRLSGYWHPFREKNTDGNLTDKFIHGASFENAIELYEFDRELRLLVMSAIERVEVYLRTLIAYHLGHTYGAFGHTDPLNFHPKFDHAKWLKKLDVEATRSKEAFIVHYNNKYKGFPTLPIWITTEVMSLGSLSLCFKGLSHADKKAISNQLNVYHKRLADWLHQLTYVRNVCAHHSRLWNRALSIRTERSKDDVWSPPITPSNDCIFYILLTLRHLLVTTEYGDNWCLDCNALLAPIASNDFLRIAMDMPENWREHPIWTQATN